MEIETITSKIDDFLNGLGPETRARALQFLDLLSDYNYKIGLPYSKSLHGGLFELRITGKKQIRIIYCFHKGKIFLLHAFVKKQNKILKKDLDLAKKRFSLLV